MKTRTVLLIALLAGLAVYWNLPGISTNDKDRSKANIQETSLTFALNENMQARALGNDGRLSESAGDPDTSSCSSDCAHGWNSKARQAEGKFAGNVESPIGQVSEAFESLNNPEMIQAYSGAVPASRGPVLVEFPVSDGSKAFARFERSKVIADDESNSGWQWSGHIDGQPQSSINFTTWNGSVFASVYAGSRGSYEWRGDLETASVYPMTNLNTLGCSVDDDGLPARSESTEPRKSDSAISPAGNLSPQPLEAALDSDAVLTEIDVLIAYSQGAADAVGGISAIEAKILTAVADANTAYANSAVEITMNVADIRLLPDFDRDPDLPFDLALIDSMVDETDGVADSFATWKRLYGADFASLWLNSNVSGGKAYVLLENSDPANAVNVIRAQNPTDTFVHEVGHNMGCRHQRTSYSGTPSARDSYSFAHLFTGNDSEDYTTVMAGITASGRRLLYFSNPDITFSGTATGIENLSDNARTLQGSRDVYANFSQAPAPTLGISVSYEGTDIPNGDSTPSPIEGTDFGSLAYGMEPLSRVFRVSNTGSIETLDLGEISSSSQDFTVSGLASSIAAGEYDDFTVSFNPTSDGLKTGTIRFSTNDENEDPFSFDVSGDARVSIDDHGDTLGGASPLALESETIAEIEVGGDKDYFQLIVSGPGILSVYTSGSTDTSGYLLDSSGNVIAESDDGEDSNFLISSEVNEGVYYIRVVGSTGETTGSYQLASSFDNDGAVDPVLELSNWVYFSWPYAYSITDSRWYYFNTSDTQNRVDLSNAQWSLLSDANGWHYYTWPYSYSIDLGTWHWYNNDTQWAVDLVDGIWLRLGGVLE